MAIGPFARILAQVVVPVIAVLARAIPKAYGEALRNARKAGVDNATAAAATNMLRKTISKTEALQILNLTEAKATPEAVLKQYEKFMAANDISKGGSFYLQSKVYRAKELLDEYIQEEQSMKEKNEAFSSSAEDDEKSRSQQSTSDQEEEAKDSNKKKKDESSS